MTDLRELLDVPLDDIKKPPVLPAGTYHGFIEKYEPGESSEKKTRFLRVMLRCTRADESLISQFPDVFTAIDVSKKSFRKDFYLMPDKSQHWRLKDMLEKIGVDVEGQTLLAAVPLMVGKSVKFELTQRANRDNTELFNEVMDGSISSEAE